MKSTSKLNKNHISFFFLLSCLVFLPSCGLLEWIKEKLGGVKPIQQEQQLPNDAQESAQINGFDENVIVSMSGKPLVTKNRLEEEKKELIASNPQLQQMLMFMDEKQLDRNLVDGLTNQAIVDKYIKEHNIHERADYVKERERMMRSVDHMLNTKFFSDEFSVAVSDGEVLKFYNEKKDVMPQLLISQGGVKAMGVEFDNKDSAQDFLQKVQQEEDISKAAENAELSDKVRDFKLIHKTSIAVEPELRDKIIGLTSFPAVQMFNVGDSFWVVRAEGKEEPKYQPFESIKDQLREYLEKEKRVAEFDKEIARLKDTYGVVVNEEYFKPAEQPEAQNQMPNIQEQQAQTEAPAATPQSV